MILRPIIRLFLPLLILSLLTAPPPRAQLTLYLEENFKTLTPGEDTNFFNGAWGNHRYTYLDGWYLIENPADTEPAISAITDTLRNYEVEVTTLIQRESAAKAFSGLVFRYGRNETEERYYIFRVSTNREWSLSFFNGSSHELKIKPTPSTSINSDGENILRVKVWGKQIEFFVNGELAGEFEDQKLTTGGYGLAVGGQTSARFSRFRVYSEEIKPEVPEPISQDFSSEASVKFPLGNLGKTRLYVSKEGEYLVNTVSDKEPPNIVYPFAAKDIEVSVDARLVAGNPKGGFGLVLRQVKDGESYSQVELLISSDGWFTVNELFRGEFKAISGWRESKAIKLGSRNRLKASAQGINFTFYINDTKVYETKHYGPPEGTFGFTAQQGNIVAFDNFELRSLGTASIVTTPDKPTPLLPKEETNNILELSKILINQTTRMERSDYKLFIGDDFDKEHIWFEDATGPIKYIYTKDLHYEIANGDSSSLGFSYVDLDIEDDFQMEATSKFSSGRDDAGFGLAYRVQPGKGYFFVLNGKGEWSFYRQNSAYKIDIVKWTKITPYYPKESQTLSVMVQGNWHQLFINDKKVGEFHDASSTKGKFGLVAQPGVTARFDLFLLWLKE